MKLNTALVNGGHPVVCIDSTGLAVIAFPTIDEVKPFEPSKQGVAVRRLAATGAIQGAQVTVANPLGRQTGVGLSCGLNGSFVVAWASDLAPATDLGDILFATYDKTAKRVGTVAKLPTTNTGTQEAPYLQHDSKGNLIAVWESESTLGRAIRGLRIRANGVVDGTDFLAVDKSSVSTRVTHPLLAFFGTTANFVVTWDEGSRERLLPALQDQLIQFSPPRRPAVRVARGGCASPGRSSPRPDDGRRGRPAPTAPAGPFAPPGPRSHSAGRRRATAPRTPKHVLFK